MEERPSQKIQEFVHFLLDNGTDMFHGHSAHIFQGVEIYDGKPILYDTGDFVDDYKVDHKLRNDRSFLFQLKIIQGEIERLELIPIEIRDYSVNLADKQARDWSFERMQKLSESLGTEFETRDEMLSLNL